MDTLNKVPKGDFLCRKNEVSQREYCKERILEVDKLTRSDFSSGYLGKKSFYVIDFV